MTNYGAKHLYLVFDLSRRIHAVVFFLCYTYFSDAVFAFLIASMFTWTGILQFSQRFPIFFLFTAVYASLPVWFTIILLMPFSSTMQPLIIKDLEWLTACERFFYFPGFLWGTYVRA